MSGCVRSPKNLSDTSDKGRTQDGHAGHTKMQKMPPKDPPAPNRCRRGLNRCLMLSLLLASIVTLLAFLVVGAILLRDGRASLGTHRRSLVSPSEDISPPRSPWSDASDDEDVKRQRGELQPLLAGRRFWNDERNVSLLRAGHDLTYGGSFTCLAPGLHVSNFPLDFDATVDRLRKIVNGTTPCPEQACLLRRGRASWIGHLLACFVSSATSSIIRLMAISISACSRRASMTLSSQTPSLSSELAWCARWDAVHL